MNFRALFSAVLSAIALTACGTPNGGRYPSLEIRDVERAEGQFEPVASETIDIPSVETNLTGPLDVRLAALVAQAEQAHDDFVAAVPAATSIVEAAAGSAVASDAWAAAQIALGDLDAARSETAVPLGDLDILVIAATVASEEHAAISAARARVLALLTEEDAVLQRLREQVA